MKRIIAGCLALAFLAACGADGEPLKPSYSTQTTIGYNSRTGPFNKTVFGVCFGDIC